MPQFWQEEICFSCYCITLPLEAARQSYHSVLSQWEARSEFLRRYGQVDAFYFDWYSIALSKTQRANRQDILDVRLLIRQGYVDVMELDRLFQDVLNKIGSPPYDRLFPNLSQQLFSQNYQTVRRLL